MSGLEKIVGRISQDSAEKAAALLSDARAKAEAITADNEKRTREECDRIRKKADSQAANIAERSQASAELKAKQILLSGRQEVMSETIQLAKEKLSAFSDAEYTDFFVKLFQKHVPTENAVLRLGRKDLGRLSADTLNGLVETAKASGAQLTVSGEPADIKDGFVLDFGGVEENCTFDALFDQNSEELLDKVRTILFA